MADAKTRKRREILLYFLTGLFVLILCFALCAAALIKPYEKLQTYLNLAFMDDMRIDPSAEGNGLVIKENDIRTENISDAELTNEGKAVMPSFGEQYAVIECKAINLLAPVYWGSSAELLERGACQSSASKVLGETGNAVIDAHVNTFFSDLHRVQVGDEIVLYTKYGVFTYKAAELVKFKNTEKKYILPTDTDQLTLYTCQAQVLGTSSTRIGVICELVSKQFYIENAGEGDAE